MMWAIPPRPRSWPGWRWGAALLLALALYLVASSLLFPALGVSVLLLSALPVAVVAWWGGPPAGLLGGLLAVPLNALLLALAGPQSGGALGPFLLLGLFVILAGGVIGRLAALEGHRRPPTVLPPPEPTHPPPARDAILTVDDDLRVLTFNQAAEDMFLLPAQAAVGQPLDRLIAGERVERLRAFERGQAPHPPPGLQQCQGLRPGGERFPIAASIAPAQADGQPCFTLTVHDLSTRHHPEAVLLGQQELLEMIARGAPLPAVLEAAVRFLESLSQGILRDITLRKQAEAAEREGRALAEALHDTAIAIQNARLFAQSRRRAEELEALRRVTLHITTRIDLPTLLETLARSALDLLGTDSGGMYLYRPERDVLEWAVAIGPHTLPIGTTLRRGEGLSGKVWESGQPLIVSDYSAWEGRAPQYDEYGFKAVLGVPIRWGSEFLGVINATTSGTTRHTFTEHDARLLSLFADQAAIAIQNARLFEQVQRHAIELEERVAARTAEIHAQQERITAILDSVADAVIVTDLQGRVVLANPVARWLLDTEPTAPLLKERIADLAAQLARHPQVTRTDIIEVGRVTYQAKAAKMLEAGQDLGQVIVLRDITCLQELDRLKSQFVNTVSHELRTPLTNIKLYLSLLERGMAERREEYLAVLQREAARLERLISNLLDLSRLEETRHVTRRQPLDLTGLVAQVVETHLPQAQEKQLTLSYRPAHEPLPPLWGDRDELVQMLTNLVANALAYTPPGGCVEVSSRPGTMLDAQSGAAIIEVRDTGIGIAEQDMLHIFDRFYRGANTVHGEIPGTGLGLAITKEIVERHQGTIEVESQLGQGSTFRVYLPLLSPDHSPLEFGGGADV